MMASAAFALIGFPLDDVWHRIFGQDVTLWGPTHLMLIGGAGLTLIGSAILIVEGRGERVERPAREPGAESFADRAVALFARYRRAFAIGGLLIGLSTFQAEFDFGVPQFQLVLEPIMLAFAAGVALVAARIWIGPGAALGAAVFFIAVRGVVALIVGPVLGETTPQMPLYLAEAACVEVVALMISTRRAYLFGAVSGVLIGTVGFFAEYAWSHVWMPVPWPESLIGEAILPAAATAIAAGVVGAFLGTSFAAAGERRRGFAPPAIIPAAVATVAIVAVVGLNVGDQTPSGWRAQVELTDVKTGPERTVDATVRLDPADARRRRLLGPGDRLAGRWPRRRPARAGLPRRLRDDPADPGPRDLEDADPAPARQLRRRAAGLPAPRTRAIPAPAVTAPARFERAFTDETEILQREQKSDVPSYLAAIAYTVVAAIVLAILLLLGWVLTRIARPDEGDSTSDRSRPRTAPGRARQAPA